jgi:hypothetical protein
VLAFVPRPLWRKANELRVEINLTPTEPANLFPALASEQQQSHYIEVVNVLPED